MKLLLSCPAPPPNPEKNSVLSSPGAPLWFVAVFHCFIGVIKFIISVVYLSREAVMSGTVFMELVGYDLNLQVTRVSLA